MSEGNGKKPIQPGDLVPQKHGGAIYQGPSRNPRGGLGTPPSELRERIRELGWMVLDETIQRVEESRRDVPGVYELSNMSKDELIQLVLQIRSYLTLEPRDLRSILETSFRYGVGTKHVHSGEDDGPIPLGIVVMPPLDADE